ncbi:MAG: ADP-heptose:LPS heptosyltransferase [Acidobacteria bacterium]|nr:ADP-heptose:LPS heptosyltransferase [Acidobacteriota bacterium]
MNVLVVRLSALGDVIHTLPAVVALRAAGLEIDWVVESPYRELVEMVGGVTAIPVSLKRWSRAPRVHREQIADARRSLRGHEGVIDFQGLIKSAALAWLSGTPRRYGFDWAAIRERPARLFLNRAVSVDQSRHVVDWNRQLAAAAVRDLAGWAALPDIEADFASFAADPEGKLASLRRRVVLLPGAGKWEKLWPVERFAVLARELGDRALAVWGPGEEELARAIGADVAPPTSLRELAYLLHHAELVIGGDTGPLHLAAALRAPVIGLYGPTNPRRNGPYGQLERVLSTFDGDRTMQSIAAGSVLEAIQKSK